MKIKETIMKFVFSKVGNVVTPLITAGATAGVVYAATQLTKVGIALDPETQKEIVSWTVGSVLALTNFLVLKYTGDKTEEVQPLLNKASSKDVETDRWHGPETSAAIKEVAKVAIKAPNGGKP